MPMTLRWPLFVLLAGVALALPLSAQPVSVPAATTPTVDDAAANAPETAGLVLPAAPTLTTLPLQAPAEPYPLRLNGAFRVTGSRNSSYAVDPGGARSDAGVLGSSRLTLALDLDTGKRTGNWSVIAAMSADALTGTFTGGPTLDGDKLPGNRFDTLTLSQAWAGVRIPSLLTLKAGVMTSHWGTGLLANDGHHALDTRRDEWFVLPTTGDRVARVQLLLHPFAERQTVARGLILALSLDAVVEDATAIRAQGDDAVQRVAALRWHFAKERWAGVYYVHRNQTFHGPNSPYLRVNVLDAAFDMDYRKDGTGLRVQGEAAVILGTTSLAPTPEHPEHDVRQAAVVAKARYDWGHTGLRAELDGGWFSGDDNLDDAALTGFKANPNYQQGLLLFSQVLGWQSGRARLTASNPQVSGYPSQDLDRLATNGAVTSAITVFPKVGWKATSFLEVYGGALLAFSPTAPIDAFSTRIGGGTPHTYTGKPTDGSLLGAEFDLGVVATLQRPGYPLVTQLRAEYAVLAPGGALAGLENDAPIHGGRLSLTLSRAPLTSTTYAPLPTTPSTATPSTEPEAK